MLHPLCKFIAMGEPRTLEIGLADNGDHGLLETEDCSWSFEQKGNVRSQRLFKMLKCSLLKVALDGADKVIKDPRAQKLNFAVRESHLGLASEHGDLRRPSFDSSDTIATERGDEPESPLRAKERVCRQSANPLHSNSDYNPFPLNILAFTVAVLMKTIGFLMVSFLAFPIRLSYFSFMLFLFPFRTLGRIQGYFMKNVLRTLRVTSANGTSAVSERLPAEKSLAVILGLACFRSIYVCSMLLGILASGFVLSGFIMRHLVQKPIQSTQNLNFDYTKSSPVAFVPLTASSGVGSHRAIPYNHKLQLAASLTLPESEYNQKLGVFQVRVEFLSANGNVTASSSYPCMLRYKSGMIRLIETFLRSAPLLTGLQSETQVLDIKMGEHIEGLKPTACLKVILEQRAEFQSVAGIPQIYSASLVLESELPLLKRLVWYWRRTIFVWTSIISFLTELVLILAFFRPLIVPKGRPKIDYRT